MPGAGEAQNSLQPGAPLDKVVPHVPESKERYGEPQPPVQIARLKEPIEGVTKIIDLRIALRQPASPISGTQFRISFLRKDQTVRRMCPPRRWLFAPW